MVNEHNIKNSFRTVKSDILRLEGELINLKEQQAKIIFELEKLVAKKPATKKKAATKKKTTKKR